jgi:hypothetical protein
MPEQNFSTSALQATRGLLPCGWSAARAIADENARAAASRIRALFIGRDLGLGDSMVNARAVAAATAKM